MDRWAVSFLVLTCAASTSALPTLDLPDHVTRLTLSQDLDGYSLATLHVLGDARPLTRRDLEAHADATEKTFSLRMADSGDELRMSLVRRLNVDTSGIRFYEHTEEGKRELRDIQVRDCFFDGPLTDGQGHAHMSLCGGELTGSIRTNDRRLYEVLSLPEVTDKRSAEEDDAMRVLVTWKADDKGALLADLGLLEQAAFNDSHDDSPPLAVDYDYLSAKLSEMTPEKQSTAVKIEIGNYLDQYYIEDCASKLGKTDNQKLTDLQILKFSAAAKMMDTPRISYKVTLKLAEITFMKTHPSWYAAKTTDAIGDRLNLICKGTANRNFDQVTLSTSRTSNPGIIGLAWIKTVCSPQWRCAASRAVNTDYWTELHELGHNLGLNHDNLMSECNNDPDKNGYMGLNKQIFLRCYKARLEATFAERSKFGCLYTDNVQTSVGSWVGK